MTDTPLSLEQQLSNAIQLSQNLESVNREAKAICDGLIQRCATLACERDNIKRALDAANASNESLRGQLLALQAQKAPVVLEAA